MRRGFSMIELIFVIVILGILASVAVPKLVGTRDDAQASNLLDNIGNIQRGLPGYFFATGITPNGATDLTPAINWNGWSLETNPTGTSAKGSNAYVFKIQSKNAVAVYINNTDDNLTSIDFLVGVGDYFNGTSTLKTTIENKLGFSMNSGAEINVTVVTQSILF